MTDGAATIAMLRACAAYNVGEVFLTPEETQIVTPRPEPALRPPDPAYYPEEPEGVEEPIAW